MAAEYPKATWAPSPNFSRGRREPDVMPPSCRSSSPMSSPWFGRVQGTLDFHEFETATLSEVGG